MTPVLTLTELLDALRARDIRISEENGELRVRAPGGALTDDLRNELRRQKADVLALLVKMRASTPTPIPHVTRTETVPLSSAQRRLWFLEQLRADGPSAYNIATAFIAEGPLDIATLEQALGDVIDRHEVLRTGVVDHNGEPTGILAERGSTRIDVADIAGHDDAISAFRAEAARIADAPFDLASPPLIRVAVRRMGAERFGCVVVLHHLISDGESMPILMRDLAACYSDRLQHRASSLPTLRIQYADFAEWQNAQPDAAPLAFWRNQFTPLPDPLELPTDFPRPTSQSFAGQTIAFQIEPDVVTGINAVSRTTGASLFMTLLAGTTVVLQQWTAQDDITIGTPARGRPHADLEDQVGCFVNTLALRCRLNRHEPFIDLLTRVRDTVTRAFDHESYPFDRLVDQLSVRRDTGRSPLFDVMLSLAPAASAALALHGVRVTTVDLGRDVSQLDLTFNFAPSSTVPGALDASVQYRTDLFSAARMARLIAHVRSTLARMARTPAASLSAIGALADDERRRVLVSVNDTAAPYGVEETLVSRFVTQAAATPDAIAVIDGERRWTYREIDQRSSGVAHALRARGVGVESRVAILVERSERMMTGLLGVLKAGAGYVPIQPRDPERRIESLIADCQPTAVLRDADIAEWATINAPTATPDVRPDNLAYVIYTSGSTGQPKGVLIEHGSVINRITWMDRAYGLTPGDVILQKTPYTFDVSVWELFWWAFSGATVAFLPPDAEKDPAAIVDAVHRHGVTTMHFVPSMLRAFLDHVRDEDVARLSTLRNVFASGEALTADLVHRFYETLYRHNGTRLHNLYGPTEATVDVSYFDCGQLGSATLVPIGAPVANTQLYVLDRDLEPVALGVTGEIYIGGVNVGRGYLNRADLTADRFVPDPWSTTPGRRLYRTGDVGRWRDDGQLEYLGRNDHQVKIRGHRIELGEIESVLLSHPDVQNAAVIVRDEQLTAYLKSSSTLTVGGLRAFLTDRLPPYMVPTRFAVIDTWPLTSSGKLDRRALPAPESVGLATGRQFTAPRTETERRIAALFASVLNVTDVGADDDFFERGGHSLLATRVIAHARQEHGLDLNLRDVFAHPTVSALAECADRREPFRGKPLRAVETQAHYVMSHAQRRLWLSEQRAPDAAAYNVAVAFTGTGTLNIAALTDAWRRLQARHESLRTAFRVVNGEPRQFIADAPDTRIDVDTCDVAAFEAEAARIAGLPFDLTHAPLVRMAVRHFSPTSFGWVIVMHHIVCDGWSMPILVRELVAFYEDACAKRASRMAPLRRQYKDFAAWQRSLVDDDTIEPHRQFWRGMFPAPPPRIRLPFDAATTSADDAVVDRVVVPIDATLTSALTDIARQHNASLFIALLALVNALLYRYTGQRDLTVGTVTAGRIHPDVEKQIGFYVNTLALRTTVDADESFAAFLDRVRDRTLESFDHQVYPFDRLVEDLDVPADGRFPVFDVMVVLQNNETAELRLPGITLQSVTLPPTGSKFDLSFHFAETAGAIELTLEFRADRFDRAPVDRMGAEFLRLVNAVLATPTVSLSALPLPAGATREQTIAVASTFTAEPIEEPLAFWMSRLGTPTQIVFAPFGQVFQELLDPSSAIGRNRDGANLCLLRLSDWEQSANALVPLKDRDAVFAGHDTHRLPNGAIVAHLNSYETEDVYQEIFIDRVYARHGITLNDGDVVFDIGANIGLFSLFASSTAANLRLFGFEPAPATFEALRRNTSAYCPSARVFNCGIGAAEGRAPFTFYPKSSVFSSYHPDAEADAAAIRAVVRNVVEREGEASATAVTAATDVFMADRLTAETVMVPIRTLSGIIREHGIEQIHLLKLDAEKSERGILNGLDATDWQKIQQIVIEVHDSGDGTLDFVTGIVQANGFEVIVEEEARLQESGLFSVYGWRGARRSAVASRPNNTEIFSRALRAAALRAPAVPFVVVACPEVNAPLRDAEQQLAQELATIPGVTFVSSAQLAEAYPVASPHDPRADRLGAVPYTPETYAAIATMAVRRIEATRRSPFKVIVLDADHTLWRGVVGEDGPEGITLDAPRRALQAFMAAQRRNGMLLAICSKNVDDDVVRAFDVHAEMPLGLGDFAARRVNWQPKSENLKSLASQLNVGLDSFIFVDDNPLECAEVRAACPEVATLCLPADIEQIPAFLAGSWVFDGAATTVEDAKRADFYSAAGDRDRLRAEAPSLGDFISSLELAIDITPMSEADIPRTAQLTQRTNQFNTTTRRRTEADIIGLATHGRAVSVVRVRDRFGDYGLVGVATYGSTDTSLLADAMMLSCRALGRGVEHRMVAALGAEAQQRGLAHVDLEFAPTPKNSPARDFLNSLTDAECIADGDRRIYRLTSGAAAALTFVPTDTAIVTDEDTAPAATSSVVARRPTGVETGVFRAAEIADAAVAWSRAQGRSAQRPRRANITAPKTAVEHSLAAIWANLLGVDDVGTNESFFDLGGHSLKAIRMLSRAAQVLGAELTLGDLFADPTIRGLATRAGSGRATANTPIPPAAPAATYPLSGAQRRLWILSEMGGDGTVAYNVPAAFVLSGDVRIDALNDAFSRLIARHESLRTRFVVVDGQPRQEIVDAPSFAVEVRTTPVTEEAFAREAAALAHQPIGFDQAPLLRAALRALDGQRWGLSIVMHHVVTDGWSMPILVRELLAFYDDARRGVASTLPPLRVHYKDYAVWQQAQLESSAAADADAFWREMFHEPPPAIDLPTDAPRPPVQRFHGETLSLTINRDVADGLRALSTRHGATLFMTLLAALDVLLYRYTGESDVTVGSPMTGRVHPDLEDQVGFYVNTLALRTRLNPREPFASLLDRVRDTTAAAFGHQSWPFDRLVEGLRLPRNLGRSPLFDIMLVVEQESASRLVLPEIDVRPIALTHNISRFDMTFHFSERAEGLELGVQYATALFSADRVRAMSRHLESLLKSVAAQPALPVADIPLVDAHERTRLVAEMATGAIVTVPARSLVDAFRDQVTLAPAAPALIDADGTTVTYRELDERSDRVAVDLISRGLQTEQIVGVCAPRSVFTFVAMLGVMKAGGVYLPLDPAIPQARRDFMVADSHASFVLDAEPREGVGRTVPSPAADQLAYVIYTSGSTGVPKGVGVTHAALLNMATDQIRAFGLGPHDIFGQFSSVSFDASIYETFLTLLSGATLAIVPDNARVDPQTFVEWCGRTKVTTFVLPPAFVRTLERVVLPSVRVMITAGEAADRDDATHYATTVRYINAYGPTECAVCATWSDIEATGHGRVPIGRPIINSTTYVLDAFGAPVPVGVPGELYLGGAGLARGYVGRPDLTADRFVPDPFSNVPGARLYRTGDVVRWRADGQLEFVGRNDFQVKVRGHRIELGEVENALRAVPTVRDAVVVARTLDLVAYVTGDAVSSDNVKTAIRASLPDYMVPAHVIVMDALPLTPSGKIDRGALPEVLHAAAPATVFEEASTELERSIARVWQEVLDVPRVGVRDSFFDLGGNSILLARVLSQLRRDVAPHLTLLDLFTFPRIQDLAAHLSASSPAKEQQAATRISDRAEKQRAALAKNRRPPR